MGITNGAIRADHIPLAKIVLTTTLKVPTDSPKTELMREYRTKTTIIETDKTRMAKPGCESKLSSKSRLLARR
jgi:hypothetical protein